MLRIILFFFPAFFCFTLFSVAPVKRPLSVRAKEIFEIEQKLLRNNSSLSQELINQWNSPEKRDELYQKYILFFEDFTAQLFSENGISPKTHFSWKSIAPLYLVYAQQHLEKREGLAYILALVGTQQFDSSEKELKTFLQKKTDDKRANLLAGILLPLKPESSFFQKKWNEIAKKPSKDLVITGLRLWEYLNISPFFKNYIYFLLAAEHKGIFKNLTTDQKGMFLLSYAQYTLMNAPQKVAWKRVALEMLKSSIFYTVLTPELKGKKITIVFSHDLNSSMGIFETQKKKDAFFQFILKVGSANPDGEPLTIHGVTEDDTFLVPE